MGAFMIFQKMLGICFKEAHDDGVTLTLPIKPEFINGAGVLHGGVCATLADACAGGGIHNVIGRTSRMTTVELKINYLRPVVEGTLTARAKVVKAGNTICVANVDIFDDQDKQIGVARVTYMLLGPMTPEQVERRKSRPEVFGEAWGKDDSVSSSETF